MPDLTEYLEIFIAEMSEKDRKAYLIAKSHLGMSFQLEKSNVFVEWLKQYLEMPITK